MINNVSIGEVVILNSGGPKMTIVSVDNNEIEAKCKYYNNITGLFVYELCRMSTLSRVKADD